MSRFTLLLGLLLFFGIGSATWAVPFVNSYTDGESWNSIYAQGFSPFIQPSPDPEVGLLDTVSLDRFQFFKGGLDEENGIVDVTVPFQLAIVDDYFVNLDGFDVNNANLIALSTNAINGTTGLSVGDPISFQFSDVELIFGLDYAAIYVTNDGGMLSPVMVPSLIADYVETEEGSGIYVPESDYGDPDTEFLYSVSNFLNVNEFGTFLQTFDAPYADASFIASYNLEPLTGDYNNDGAVDAVDYSVWRDNLGSDIALPNESETIGQVTSEDFSVWLANYGQPFAGVAAGSIGTPEPTAWGLLAAASLLSAGVIRSRRDPFRTR